MPSSDGSISIPQVAACVIIGYIVLRWIFKSPETESSTRSASSTGTATPASRRPVDRRRLAQQVEVVKGMFPQFSEAAIEAELMRNGMSIEVTTDRILSTGFLPEPPRPAQPASTSASQTPTPGGAAAQRRRTPNTQATTPATGSSSSPKITSQYPDLITRYNLHHRLNEDPETAPTYTGKGKAPASKVDLQSAHKAKRDAMVLEARRTVEAMIKEGKHPI
ncbi:hypothetical protein EX30DRAFT_320130 [Ascodesmis nigricans]|uniref:CUE domain-containing protein n=1 Tax=Ascodesmis nigricans TaxID=341454 RepID=A0A4S2MVK0_9PEZI|nr:hypothetical protein EX30DRAFT_320130 [Ascodesmis nigricans]